MCYLFEGRVSTGGWQFLVEDCLLDISNYKSASPGGCFKGTWEHPTFLKKKNLILERNQRECWFPWVRRCWCCCCCCCCYVFSFSWCALAWKLRDSQPQTCCGGWKTQHRICLGWDSPVVWKAFWILLNSPFDLILFPYFLCCNDCKGSFTWRYPDDCKPEILSLSNGIKRPTTSQQPYQ